ncbi:MAG TPA: hypothetical protein VF455_06715 [Chryseobacterium sp.]
MRRIIFLLFLLTLFYCKKEETSVVKENKDTVEYESTNWQESFGLTHSIDLDSVWGKPVRYYITNKNLDSKAIKFYLGNYRPKDEPETARLLNLVTTDNDSLRPFYRWILNKTILIQDGALAEYTGVSARKYAEKFPKEFFEYIDFDKSGKTYLDWYNSIAYSGFYDSDDYKNPKKIEGDLILKMSINCKNCDMEMKKRIAKFAKDCFSNK